MLAGVMQPDYQETCVETIKSSLIRISRMDIYSRYILVDTQGDI